MSVPGAATVGERVARGVVWLIAQTVALRGVRLAGQVVLAWLLLPEHFGLIGLAHSITAFTGLIQEPGIRLVLIQRQRRFETWANPAFWLSLVTGVAGGLAIVAAAPLAAAFYDEPALVGLLLVLALDSPLHTLRTVPTARLQSEMRFKAVAQVGIVGAVCETLLTVMFAWLGYGAYSFVLPLPLTSLVVLAMLWRTAPGGVRARLQVRRWRYLLGDTALALLASLFLTVIAQADYMVLGRLFAASVVGVYFFAFRLSTQALSLVTDNVRSVLFPALTQFRGDVRRQTEAFLRAARLLALLAVPVCLLQAVLAGPVIRAVFSEQWAGAIPLLQVLSVAMAFRVVGSTSGSLNLAQRRMWFRVVVSVAYAALFLVAVVIGARAGGALGTALAVAAANLVIYPSHMYLSIRPGGGRWRDIGGMYLVPLVASGAALGAGAGLAALVPAMPGADWVRIAVVLAVAAPLYTALFRWLAPADWKDLMGRMLQASGRRG